MTKRGRFQTHYSNIFDECDMLDVKCLSDAIIPGILQVNNGALVDFIAIPYLPG